MPKAIEENRAVVLVRAESMVAELRLIRDQLVLKGRAMIVQAVRSVVNRPVRAVLAVEVVQAVLAKARVMQRDSK